MRTSCFIFSIFFVFILKGQTLTQANHAPVPGETFTLVACDSTNVNPGNGGNAALWDFSELVISNRENPYSVFSTSGVSHTPATIGFAASSGTAAYFRASSANLEYYGGVIQVSHWVASLEYSAPAVLATYPMTLNSTTSCVTSGSIHIIQFPGTFNGTCQVLADGSGTLILPGSRAMYPECLRIVTTQTVAFSAHTVPGSFIKTDYEYYANGVKFPLLTISIISSTLAGGVPPVHTLTFVSVYKDYLAASTVGLVKMESNGPGAGFYPNPANGIVNFYVNSETTKQLFIYNSLGTLVAVHAVEGRDLSIDMSSFKKGIYHYQLRGPGSEVIRSGKIVLDS